MVTLTTADKKVRANGYCDRCGWPVPTRQADAIAEAAEEQPDRARSPRYRIVM